MIEKDFRQPRQDELQEGAPIWLLGKSFLDTLSIGRRPTPFEGHPICGPFLIERVLFKNQIEPRVDIIDPATGDRRAMLCSWLLVPKEDDNVR